MASKTSKQIDDLIKQLESLVPDIQKEMRAVGSEFIKELKKTHSNETNPYGVKWKERKDNLPHPILTKTGKMKAAYKSYPQKNGVLITNTAAYSGFHDLGTSSIPQRLMLPTIQKGLPEVWFKLLSKRVQTLIQKKFGG